MNPNIKTTAATEMPVTVHTLGDRGGLELGFRQGWISADDVDNGVSAELLTGAGCGTPYMILHVTRPGKPLIVETVDMSDHLAAWINAAIARADAAAEVTA